MKRTLLFMTCVLASVMMYAQEESNEYRPLVVEGKHWTYDNFMPFRPAKYDHYYWYDLKGDTLISGKKCLKMYSENLANDSVVRYVGALYEESKKVHCFYPGKDKAELLYDFDCKVGDTLHIDGSRLLVKDIRTEDNGGIAIKKYTLWDYEEVYVVWIEGVGAMTDFFKMTPLPGNYNSLNACELNGEKLYQWINPDYTEKDYHKMGIEGKRWNYIHYYLDEDGEHRAPYSYVVKGDTVIRRTTYKKLWYQDEKSERLVCLILEQGRLVLKSLDFGDNSYDAPIMRSFFDFGRDDFGRVFTWNAKVNTGNTNWMPYGVDTIEVKGQPFRRFTCLQKYSKEGETLTTIEYNGEDVWRDIWVEGIGSESSGIEDQIPLHEQPVRTTSDYTYFVSCDEGGECIFTASDFNIQTKSVADMAYRPFIEEGKVWKVGTISGNPVQVVDYYYFDGDTIIDGKSCKQMMCQRYVSPDYSNEYWTPTSSLSKVGAWYEENKKVYFYDEIRHSMEMKYDFSLNAYDTLQINDEFYVIGPKQMGGIKGFKGVYRNVVMWTPGNSNYSTTWLEGVGGLLGPRINAYNPILSDAMPEFLMSCTVGDEVIYFSDEYEDGATPDVLETKKVRFDFTHTVKTQPKAPKRKVAEKSLYGEYNAQQLDINLSSLEDEYMVHITDASGKVVYEKTINAGNIVGLNVDISTFAEGSYTVSVENSRESFVGEFNSDTTGIEEVRSKRLEPNGHYIYNLQGQRLSDKPAKGLYIQNGVKRVIK